MSRRPPPRNVPPEQQRPREGGSPASWARWIPLLVIAGIGFVLLSGVLDGDPDRADLSFSEFTEVVADGDVTEVTYEPGNGNITGTFAEPQDGMDEFRAVGPQNDLPESTVQLLDEQGVELSYRMEQSNWFVENVLPLLIIFALIAVVMIFVMRRAQGQMGGVMNIGRSRAKVYNTEKPRTRFDDVAGYAPVKQEIAEVVDFLKNPGKFKEIGARIPKGVLLVGPPGTGKTLIARAVAGEAGVPFVSVTGSDFMEMFVGVGAARVRDLFNTARKQAPSIIFVDEVDSIGRKRGAGVGGGHDEREQTLNQMLAEMDGFEATEGIVMMAATNRPDVLDPALLRPGRFDRQVMVPLPTQDERVEILKTHFRDKKISADVNLEIVARGTPGMAGADLANLVNEAALFAVRRGEHTVHAEDFEHARDRVLMGLKRDSMALTEEEKEVIAFHEGGHAVLGYVLEHADPVHKVTILPSGMALGVTQQLPVEERHIYKREYIADSLVVRLGGRIAEEIVFGHLSTGAQNDLVGCTELARKMVREWGMSDRIGPMAWGSQGAVFLGEDLVHTRDYSDDTARVIDEEVERILREEEDRARKVLTEYRAGLEAVAAALLERETISGEEVGRLVDDALGHKAGGPRVSVRADGTEVEVPPPPDGDSLSDVVDVIGGTGAAIEEES